MEMKRITQDPTGYTVMFRTNRYFFRPFSLLSSFYTSPSSFPSFFLQFSLLFSFSISPSSLASFSLTFSLLFNFLYPPFLPSRVLPFSLLSSCSRYPSLPSFFLHKNWSKIASFSLLFCVTNKLNNLDLCLPTASPTTFLPFATHSLARLFVIHLDSFHAMYYISTLTVYIELVLFVHAE